MKQATRDPERIAPLLNAIKGIWESSPDLRLGQLIMILVRSKDPFPDLFYLEDDELEQKVREYSDRTEKTGL